MTRRDEIQIQLLLHLTSPRKRILLSPRLYRAARHHPHFRFFMHRFGHLDHQRKTMRTTPIKVSRDEYPMLDEGRKFAAPIVQEAMVLARMPAGRAMDHLWDKWFAGDASKAEPLRGMENGPIWWGYDAGVEEESVGQTPKESV